MGYIKYIWLISSLLLNDGFFNSAFFPTWTSAALASTFLPIFSATAMNYVSAASATSAASAGASIAAGSAASVASAPVDIG